MHYGTDCSLNETKYFVTGDQLSCHVDDAAAGLSNSSDRHRVALAAQHSSQFTVGNVGLTGDVVT